MATATLSRCVETRGGSTHARQKLNRDLRPDVELVTQRIHTNTQRERSAMRESHWG